MPDDVAAFQRNLSLRHVDSPPNSSLPIPSERRYEIESEGAERERETMSSAGKRLHATPARTSARVRAKTLRLGPGHGGGDDILGTVQTRSGRFIVKRLPARRARGRPR